MNILKASLALAVSMFALTATAANDIANFGRYADDNRRVTAQPNTGSRVVFMGNSITDFWPDNRPEFFALNDFIGRGIQVTKSGVYCVSLDFITKEASVREVTGMCVLNCFTKKSQADLTYAGAGCWSGDWQVNTQMPWGEETRYRLMMTLGDEKVEWGYTLGATKEPDGTDEYYNMMRVVPANTWANTWRIPASYNGKTVRLTATLRGTYTHRYADVTSMAEIEATDAGIVRQGGTVTIALTDAVIYNMSGAQVAAVSKGESLTLPEGLYVASSGAISQKIIIRN